MTERIDHAAEARKHIDWAHEQQGEEGQFDETVQHNATLAVAEATLALVEQQRIANLIQLMHVPTGQLSDDIKDALHRAFKNDRDWETELKERLELR